MAKKVRRDKTSTKPMSLLGSNQSHAHLIIPVAFREKQSIILVAVVQPISVEEASYSVDIVVGKLWVPNLSIIRF